MGQVTGWLVVAQDGTQAAKLRPQGQKDQKIARGHRKAHTRHRHTRKTADKEPKRNHSSALKHGKQQRRYR